MNQPARSNGRHLLTPPRGLVLAIVALLGVSGVFAFDIQVQAVGGGAIPEWTYLINEDNTGDPWDPDPTNHPTLKHTASNSPIAAAGDQSTAAGVALPDGRYLISVRAPGHKLWGQHIRLVGGALSQVTPFTGVITPLGTSTVTIELLADPQPLTRILVQVFEDNQPTNSAPDPLEQRLEGFQVSLHDSVGDVTVDWYGNPLCTQYERDANGNLILGIDGNPIPIPETGGGCFTDANGEVVIDEIAYGKYWIHAIPPPGSDWVGTSTLEGTRFLAAWLEEGSDGTRFGRTTGLDYLGPEVYWYGFIRPTQFATPGGGQISGRVVNGLGFPPTMQFSLDLREPMPYPWIALNNLSGNDEMVYAAQGGPDGSFNVTGVPDGLYQLAIWDEERHWIIGYYTVEITGGSSMDLGEIGARRWFGWLSGHVFIDENGNGLFDTGEAPVPALDLLIRHRDGSVDDDTFTDVNGYYEFSKAISELGRTNVAEVAQGRFGVSGHSTLDIYKPGAVPQVFPGDLGGELLAAQLTWESRRSVIDWGKRVYDTTLGENGGIAGATIFATTRNEYNSRLAAAEPYEPGVPAVTLKLWEVIAAPPYAFCDPDITESCARGMQLYEAPSDSWVHPTAAGGNGCDVLDMFGVAVPGATPAMVADNCIEVPMLGNETHDSAWDGGWAIDVICPAGWPCTEAEEVPMPPGDYIVEAVTPPFYQILKEEDQNTDEGSDLSPLVLPPPCVGPPHLVVDPRNPYNGQMMPLCNMKLVTVEPGENAACDFYFFTDSDTDGLAETRTWATTQAVPIPGRVFGVVENDLFVDTDPNSVTFAEPRPVAHVPVGVRDYTGRLLTMVYTDEYGRYEVLLPSSFQANCPIPGGVCAGMFIINPNDPGDPANPAPGFDATYKLTTTTWEVWPGKTTAADTPIDPLQGADGGSGACDALPGDDLPTQPDVPPIDPETFPPQVYLVSSPVGTWGDSITITGPRFRKPGTIGDQGTGQVTLDGVPVPIVSWTNEDITFTIPPPPAVFAGPRQLVVTTDDGQSTVPGITIHVIGGRYNPTLVHVFPPIDPDDPVIQTAIDGAPNGALIVVHPGHYRENVIVSRGISLQGYGQGGYRNVEFPPPGRTFIQGSVIDGKWIFTSQVRQLAWDATLAGASFNDNGQVVPKGASITVLADDLPDDAPVMLDGLRIGFGAGEGGGGVHIHAFCDRCQIANNLIEENQGTLAGGISLGQPTRTVPPSVVHNMNALIRIHHNRLIGNGATLYGGGVGIFGGAEGYSINYNRICGNFSAQYGGGIAHWGRSGRGRIQDNQIYFNDSYDEGGGILIGGEALETVPGTTGSGAVTISHNVMQGNLSNDDGGGIRLLHPGSYLIQIHNNILNNNVAADLGGGIAMGDASNVRIFNNTIAGNHSTATAEDRDLTCFTGGLPPYPGAGCPHAAGLVSEGHSTAFQASLPPGAPVFSNPILFNNIFWDNDAMTWDPVGGIVTQRIWDLEVFGTTTQQYFSPMYSVLTVPNNPGGDDPSNFIGDPGPITVAPEVPMFVSPEIGETLGYDVRAIANLVDGAITLVLERPPSRPGDFHLVPTSAAANSGIATFAGVAAPTSDYEHDVRPQQGSFDRGADEIRPADTFGPAFDQFGEPVVSPNPTLGAGSVVLNATASDTATGGSNVVAIEWFVGADPGLGLGNPMTPVDGGFNSPTEAAVANIGVSGWTLGDHVINVRARDSAGNWGLLDNVILSVTLPPSAIYFSTETDSVIPGVAAPYDDADIYLWNGATFGRVFSATAAGLPASADIDALKVAGGVYYMSFAGGTTVPGLGAVGGSTIVAYDSGSTTWSVFFDGSDVDLTDTAEDIDSFDILSGGSVVVSTAGTASVAALTSFGEDLLRCDGSFGATTSCTWSLYFDGSDIALGGGLENVDGARASGVDLYLSTSGAYTVGGSFTGGGDDIFACQAVTFGATSACTGGYSLLFDGSLNGLVDNVDAFDF